MKQFLLSSTICILSIGALQAQSLTITPNPKKIIYEGVNLNQFNDLEEHVSVKNNTNDTIHLKWQRQIPSACPPGWETLICDNVNCYAAETSTNYSPVTNPNLIYPFTLAPGETYDNFLIHLRPGPSAGCCKVNLLFSTIDNQDEILETLVYDISINDPNCLLSSTKEPTVLESLNVFPNPTTGEFSISDNPLVKEIAVYNTMGQKMCQYPHANGKAHDISHVANGLYFVNLLDENGQPLKTVRMSKSSSNQ
jgi:hypothetical protein